VTIATAPELLTVAGLIGLGTVGFFAGRIVAGELYDKTVEIGNNLQGENNWMQKQNM
jgi:hypothetical protein